MMQLAILTNVDEHCGIAEYARNLQGALEPWYKVALFLPEEFVEAALYGQVVLVNWHPARVHISVEWVRRMQTEGQAKVVLIHHNSRHEPVQVAEGDLLDTVDAVVAHEPFLLTVWNAGQQYRVKPVTYIPHGFPAVDGLLECPSSDLVLGTGGFAFPWKRFDVVIEAARRLGGHANMVCPPYPSLNVQELESRWMAVLGACLRMEKSFLSQEAVVRRLALSTINIFWFQSGEAADEFGQTGAARFGVAARRPMIISRHRKFRMLLEEYPEEFYVADTEDDVYRLVEQIWAALRKSESVKCPRRVIEEQAWPMAAARYRCLIRSLTGERNG